MTCLLTSMRQTWVPPEDLLHTGRLGSAGSELPASSPASLLLCSPPRAVRRSLTAMRLPGEAWPRLPRLLGPRLRFPSPTAYLDARACSEPAAHAPANARRVGDGSPALRKTGLLRGEARTSRVTGPSSSCAPWSTRSLSAAPPLRIRPLLAPTSLREDPRRGRRRLQGKENPRHPECHSFRGRNPTAHTLARLRFAGPVAETVARLATGSGGLTPGRAGFAPAGRRIEISWSHRKSSNPNRPAEPDRTFSPMP